MARLAPWYKVVTPREDLREGKPLDAAEFAVHLDDVREGRAGEDYQNPERFFERTFLTKNLRDLASQVIRRLSGEKTETSAVYNMATQFGGGKTHALTLIYHLAVHGKKASSWSGVRQILEQGGIKEVPEAATATFVGTEFDSIQGRGGDDGTPKRHTPWGEIAFQLGGVESFGIVAQHDERLEAPAGDVIRKFLPKDKPSLILVDELLNYVSRNRKSGLATQLYHFLQDLGGVAAGSDRVVLVASIPASELEMTVDDQSDYERFKKLLDRVGKPVVMSAEAETSEIIRRRLFEWEPGAVTQEGKVLLPKDAYRTCGEYADWLAQNRSQIPDWFSVDHARSEFEATYPFHPTVLSVFERKWRALPRFQQTRGILRLLALWVAQAYGEGFKGAHKDPLIALGSAPLDQSMFRTAMFEQLGESRLEAAVTTDICGKKGAHGLRLDEESVDTIRKARVHRKVATTIFFESNGGQSRVEATVPEVRLAVAGPDIDIGNVETALEALTDSCYYLTTERNRYQFSLKENLNKRFADRRASVRGEDIDTQVREEIQKVFAPGEGVERVFFPEKSGQIPDRPAVTLVVLDPEYTDQGNGNAESKVETMTREYGKAARTFKSALIWIVPDSASTLKEEARKLLAWEDIREEGLKLDETQQKQLDGNIRKARRDLTEIVWRTYKNIMLLGRENTIQTVDLGLVTSSAAETLPRLILSRLRQTGEVEKEISARFLVRNWPPAFTEWSTRSVRDAFYASPQFPRLLNQDAVRSAIARGVSEHHIAYVGKSSTGTYEPFVFETKLDEADVDISEDMYILTAEEARKHIEPPRLEKLLVSPSSTLVKPETKQAYKAEGLDQFGQQFRIEDVKWSATGGTISEEGVYSAGHDEGDFTILATSGEVVGHGSVTIAPEAGTGPGQQTPPPRQTQGLTWEGEIPPQKWTNFYMKVLTKLVSLGGLKLTVTIESSPDQGITDQQLEETRTALRGLGLNEQVQKK